MKPQVPPSLGSALLVVVLAQLAAAADLVIDWTSVDLVGGVAVGTLDGSSVTLTGGFVDAGVTDGTFAGFDKSWFAPQLASTDAVWVRGTDPAQHYTVQFESPVTDPFLHLKSLASTLTFTSGPVGLAKVSGESTFVVSGLSVQGTFDDTTSIGHDANGTVRLLGTFSSLSFDALFVGPPVIDDGITIQIGTTTVCQTDLGFAGPGSTMLTVCGQPLSTSHSATLTISGGTPGAFAYLLASLTATPTFVPGVGGTIVPIPILLTVIVPLDGNGGLALPVPGGGGPLTVYVQVLSKDPAQPKGWEISNTLELDFLP